MRQFIYQHRSYLNNELINAVVKSVTFLALVMISLINSSMITIAVKEYFKINAACR